MYLLDTNILSYWMRGDQALIARIKDQSPSDLAIAAISLAEILYGIEKSKTKKKIRTEKIKKIATALDILPFDEAIAPFYAGIRSELERKGRVIGERDIQIAAIAKANNLIVVTHNTKEFDRISKLRVEDWMI